MNIYLSSFWQAIRFQQKKHTNKNVIRFSNYFLFPFCRRYPRAYLELEHLQPLVGELEEGQRGLHDVQRVDHVARHVGRAQVTGRHRAELQQGVQDAGEHLEETGSRRKEGMFQDYK